MKAAPSPFKLLAGMTRAGWTFEPEPSQHPPSSILTIPDACLSRCFIQELDAFDGSAMLRWRSSGLATIFWKLQDAGFRVKTSAFERIIVQIFIMQILCKSYDWLINYLYATINLSSRTMEFSLTVKGLIVFFGPACCQVSSNFLEELKTWLSWNGRGS